MMGDHGQGGGASDKPSVVEAMSAVMEDVQSIGKKDRNTQQNYAFRGIDAVVNAVGPVFRKHGVVAVPVKSEAKYRDVQTSQGKPSRECTVNVTYRFYGPAGDYIDAEVPGESMDFGDKGAPKAMSVAYRIALLQALCIPTHDPEPDAQTYERAAPPAPAEPTWDPIDQETLFDSWSAEISRASAAEIPEIARKLLKAKREGEMSPNTYQKLGALGGRRKAELDAEAQAREAAAASLPDNTDPA